MYCKKCGHKVAEGDKFCSTCGSKVEEEMSTAQGTGMNFSFGGGSNEASVGKSAVFQFSSDRADGDEQPKKPTPPTEDFDWNIHTFPGRTVKKTEDVNFRWTASALTDQDEESSSEPLSSLTGSGLMGRDKTHTLTGSFDKALDDVAAGLFSDKPKKQTERPGALTTELNWDWTGTANKQELSGNRKNTADPNPMRPETAETEAVNVGGFDQLLSEKQETPERKEEEKPQSDKFFTFNQKNEEFQKLLDQEYEKIKSGNILSEEMHTADAVSEKKFAEIQPEDPMEHLFATEGIIKGYQPKEITTDVLDRIDAAEAQKAADETYRAMMKAQQENAKAEETARETEGVSFADVAALMKESEEAEPEESVEETIAGIAEISIADLMKEIEPEEPLEEEEVPEPVEVEPAVLIEESTSEPEEEPFIEKEPVQTVEKTDIEDTADLQETKAPTEPVDTEMGVESKPAELAKPVLNKEPEVPSEPEAIQDNATVMDAAEKNTTESISDLSLEELTTEGMMEDTAEETDTVLEAPVLTEAEIARLEAEEAARKAEAERAIQREKERAERQKAEEEAIQRAKVEADAAIAAATEKAAQARAAAEEELLAQEQRAAAEQARLAEESRKLKERHTSAEHLSEMALAREAFFTSEMPAVKAELPPQPEPVEMDLEPVAPDEVDLSMLEPVQSEPQLEEIDLDGIKPEPDISQTRAFNKEAILAGMAEATRIMAKDKAVAAGPSGQQNHGDDVQTMDLETLFDDQALSTADIGTGAEGMTSEPTKVPADTVVMSDDMFAELLRQSPEQGLQDESLYNAEEAEAPGATEPEQDIPEGMDLEDLIAGEPDDGEIQIEEEENILNTVFVDEEPEAFSGQETTGQSIQDEFYPQSETGFAEQSTDTVGVNSGYQPISEDQQVVREVEERLSAADTGRKMDDTAGFVMDDFDDDYEEESGKGRIVLKILLVILILLLVLEVAGFAIKIAAPTSGAASFIDTQLNRVIHLFTGEDTDYSVIAATETEVRTESPVDKTEMIQGQMNKNKNNNIQSIKYNASLAFDAEKTYEEGELELTQNLTDLLWYKDAENRQVYYDEAIIGAIIAFESQKMDFLNDKDTSVFSLIKKDSKLYEDLEKAGDSSTEKQTFQTLEIGEIREAGSAFYVWVSEDIEGTEADSAKEKVYMMEPDGQVMKVAACYDI